MSELAKWDSFYVIVGSAAGALIGLQFVVLTLIAERPPAGAAEAGAAFGSPTITSMSPLHYQKVLRLQEARRLMLSTMMDAGTASQRVAT
jgi:hypothetical protein